MDTAHDRLDRLRRQRLLRQSGQGRKDHRYSRPLELDDCDHLHRSAAFTAADIGNEGTMEYKNGRLEEWMTWNMPAALMMTVAFGLIFAVQNDVVQATPLGYVTCDEVIHTIDGAHGV